MGTRTRGFDDFFPKRPEADKRKDSALALGTVSATRTATIFRAPHPCTVKRVSIAVETAVAQGGSSYWTFQVTNQTQSLALMSATKATDNAGGGLTAYVNYDLAIDQNLDLATDDVLTLDCTKLASAPDLVNLYVVVEYDNRQS